MDVSRALRLASSDVVAEDFDGEFVVLDLRTGRYFGLASGAAIIWRAFIAGHSVETLSAALPPGDPRREAVALVGQQLVDAGLLVVTAEAGGGPPEHAAALAAHAGALTVETFDDLADLIMTDPIHDVDQEAGWPHLPAAADGQ